MKKLILISILAIFVSCHLKNADKKTSDQPVKIEVGKDYVASNEITYVFKDLFVFNEVVKALNANDQKGFEHIAFDSDKSIILTDTIRMRIYTVFNGYSEVRITNGYYVHEKGYVMNSTIKPAD